MSAIPDRRWDVVVIGGAVAGAGCAQLLRRFHPRAEVLIVERDEVFPPKVGESTVEVSAFYLAEVLGQGERFAREQLPKHGLRFWFTDGEERELGEMTEVGPRVLSRVPTFQLDRARLDRGVLESACEAGCHLLRPARVTAWHEGWPESRLTVETAGGETRTLRTRWIVDASGRQAFIARRKRLLARTEDHPVAAVWGRWRGVADLDCPELLAAAELPAHEHARRLATNHFCGYGWWCWVIPLANGATSVGLVYDKRFFAPPGTGPLVERFRAFVSRHDGLARLLAGATPVAGDFHALKHLPYASSRYADRGWALVGDAGAFLDPLYSPGLDHAAASAYATARLIADELAGELDDAALERRLAQHNRRFVRSYRRWLEALYLNKYEILGDAELTRCAYLLDTALYHLGVVGPVYADRAALANPSFGLGNRGSATAWRLMSLINRRLNRIARLRRHLGAYGRHNVGRRYQGPPPGIGRRAVPMLAAGLAAWLRLEMGYLAARPFRAGLDLSRPVG